MIPSEQNKIRDLIELFLNKPDEDGWHIRYLIYTAMINSGELNLSDEEKSFAIQILNILTYGVKDQDKNSMRPWYLRGKPRELDLMGKVERTLFEMRVEGDSCEKHIIPGSSKVFIKIDGKPFGIFDPVTGTIGSPPPQEKGSEDSRPFVLRGVPLNQLPRKGEGQ